MILLYTSVFSYAMIIRFYALRTYAYDLGNYNQALYTTLHGGGLLYYTADLPVTGGSMMGVHFSPILLIILPIYALYPAAPTLLVIKTFILALGAYPLYRLAKHCLKTRLWGSLFSAAYLLNPMLQGINWFDFHPEAFFPTFCLFSLYYGVKKDWLKYSLFIFLTLTTTEYAAILIIVNSLYLLWVNKGEVKNPLRAIRRLEFQKIDASLKYLTFSVVLAVVWFLVAMWVISSFSPNPIVQGGAPQWSVLGANGILDVPIRAVSAPDRAITALVYDWPLKAVYLLILFGSTAFLSFSNPRSIALTLPWLCVALLSNYSPFYYIGNQYPAFLLPPVMMGAVMGTKKLLDDSSQRRTWFKSPKVLTLFLLVSSLTFSMISSPLYGLHLATWPDLTYGIPPITEHERIVSQFVSLVPQNASIITQQNIFPLVSSRTESFVTPLGSFYPPGTDFNTTLNQWLQRSDFILLDMKTSIFETYLIYAYMKDFGISKDFGVYASNDGVILLKRSYSDNPISFMQYTSMMNWEELSLTSGEIVTDVESSNQKVLLHRVHAGSATDLCQGPLLQLEPGEYEAAFRLKIANVSSSKIATISVQMLPIELEVTTTGDELTGRKFYFSMKYSNHTVAYASRDLFEGDFSEFEVYEEFNLLFSSEIPISVAIGVIGVSPNTDLYLDWINVTQLHVFP